MSEQIEITEAAREAATNEGRSWHISLTSGRKGKPTGYHVQSLLNSETAKLRAQLAEKDAILNEIKRRFDKVEAVISSDRSAFAAVEKERDELRAAAGFCNKHQPNGGARNCLVCGCEALTTALSRISYACEPPNEMECSTFDVYRDEEAVLAQVKVVVAERDTARALLDQAKGALEMWGPCRDIVDEVNAALTAIKEAGL